jgi:hypothetical protein
MQIHVDTLIRGVNHRVKGDRAFVSITNRLVCVKGVMVLLQKPRQFVTALYKDADTPQNKG